MQEIQRTKIVYSNHKNFLHITCQCILIKIMKKKLYKSITRYY